MHPTDRGRGAPGPDRGATTDPIEQAFQELLHLHPDARVGAVAAENPSGVIPLPGEVPVGRDARRLTQSSLLDVVSPPDRAIVARLWWQARTAGSASGSVRLVHDGPAKATLSFFDLSRRYGVLGLVVVDGVVSLDTAGTGPDGHLPVVSRYARVVKDGTARLLYVDEAFERMLGYDRAELLGRRVSDLVHPDDQELAVQQWVRMCELPGPSRPVRLRHLTSDGRWVWLEVTNHNRLDDPRHGDVLADMVDISEEVAALEAVRARQQLLEQVTATVPIGLLHADTDGRLLYANHRLTELTGLRAGIRIGEWSGLATPPHRSTVEAALAAALSGTATDTLVETIDPLGDVRYCSLSIHPLLDGAGTVSGVTGSVEDVTTSVAERRELEVRAATDALTNCLNRSATLSVIQASLSEIRPCPRPARRAGGSPEGQSWPGVAVIFLDVDNLKEVNDRMGHAAGDALLVEVANRLRAAVRARDTVGRFGGDEFVLVATHVPGRDKALTVARWIASRVMRSFAIDGQTLGIRASLGVAWTDKPGVQASWLVHEADRAMYESKREGRCQPVLAG